MYQILFRSLFLAVFSATLFFSGHSGAADDPSIKGELRENIGESMSRFIERQTINGKMYLYDAALGKLLSLRFVRLHKGIVKKSDFYVSCADFEDQQGRKVDIDFLVRPANGKFITTQAMIHSISGNKRPYHLEKI